mmetsp:Transcript_7989/g.18553  ORF Transcript_7989/g.18553 Transcript_7989/m.18553 type:complete len:227 (-) Transcript_7989:390-1070(-)
MSRRSARTSLPYETASCLKNVARAHFRLKRASLSLSWRRWQTTMGICSKAPACHGRGARRWRAGSAVLSSPGIGLRPVRAFCKNSMAALCFHSRTRPPRCRSSLRLKGSSSRKMQSSLTMEPMSPVSMQSKTRFMSDSEALKFRFTQKETKVCLATFPFLLPSRAWKNSAGEPNSSLIHLMKLFICLPSLGAISLKDKWSRSPSPPKSALMSPTQRHDPVTRQKSS